MKHLIIYSHLNENSFTKAIVDRVEQLSIEKSYEIKIIDLYGDEFSPVFNMFDVEYASSGKNIPADVDVYQRLITWSDHITFVYPLWWGQMPAMLKGFLDRVLTNGFAFTYNANGPSPLLSDKTAQVYINTGSPSDVYKAKGMHDAVSMTLKEGALGFCGIDTNITFFGNVVMASKEVRQEYLDSIVV